MPLKAGVGQAMGEHLGTDLSSVRIHADAESNSISRSVQATAFTHGNDIYFADGGYAPDTAPGKRLLAHELAHVAQGQRAVGGSAAALTIGRADDPAEAEADRMADHVVSAVSTPSPEADGGLRRSVTGGAIQRSLTSTLEHAGRTAKKSARKKYKQLVGGAPAAAPLAAAGPAAAAGPIAAGPAPGWAPAAPVNAAPRATAAAPPARQTPRTKPAVAHVAPVPAVTAAAAGPVVPARKRKAKPATPAPDPALVAAAAAAADAKAQREKRRAARAQKAADKLAKDTQRIAKRQPAHLKSFAILEALVKAGTPTVKPPVVAPAVSAAPAAAPTHAPGLPTEAKDDALPSEPIHSVAPVSLPSPAPMPIRAAEAEEEKAVVPEAEPEHGADPGAVEEEKAVLPAVQQPFRFEVPEGYALPGNIPVAGAVEEEKAVVPEAPVPFQMQAPPGYALPGNVPLPEAEEEKALEAEPEHVPAKSKADDWDEVLAAAAPAAAGPAPAEEAKAPAHEAGTSRQHRAFQVNKLPDSFADETTVPSPGMGSAIGMATQKIAAAHYVMQQLKVLKTVDAAVMTQISAALAAQLEEAVFVEFKDKKPGELLSALTKYHTIKLDRLRRQDLDVADDGTVHRTMPSGEKKPYLVINGNAVLDDRKVEYDDTGEKQAQTRVNFRGGLLYRSATSTKPGKADTSDGVTFLSGVGYEIFVVDAKNNIHMASHKVGKYHHSSLLGGEPIAMGGELKVVDGKIKYMSNKSGHYMPSMESFIQFLHFLDKDGVDLDFPVYSFSGSLNGTARELLDGTIGKKDKPTNKPVDSIKTGVVIESFIAEFDEAKLDDALEAEGWHRAGKAILDVKDEPVPLQEVRRGLKRQLATKRGKPDARPWQKVETKESAAKPADVWWM